MNLLLRLILAAPAFLLAIMAHEIAHAYAAYRLGDPTARNMGRLSLDPRRHFDPLGIVVYIATMLFSRGHFAFGWAKPVLINRFNFRDLRRDFMLSSLAGPAANLLQALVWVLLLRFYLALPLPLAYPDASLPSLSAALGILISSGIMINVVLAVFNLIPIPPLDGSRLLAWLLPENLAHHMDRLEPFGILIIFLLLYFGLFSLVFDLMGGPLIGFYLRLAGA